MPDDARRLDRAGDLRSAVPVALTAIGAVSLLRAVPLLGLGLLGWWLYPLAERADRERLVRGRSVAFRRKQSRQLDLALEATFPASDPPSI